MVLIHFHHSVHNVVLNIGVLLFGLPLDSTPDVVVSGIQIRRVRRAHDVDNVFIKILGHPLKAMTILEEAESWNTYVHSLNPVLEHCSTSL